MTTNTPLLLKVEEAAEMLSIGRTRMFALIGDGTIPSVEIGRSRRIPRESLDEYVAGLMVDVQPCQGWLKGPDAMDAPQPETDCSDADLDGDSTLGAHR